MRFAGARILLVLLLLWPAGPALAGMDVSLEKETRQLRKLESSVRDLPAYRRSEEVRQRLESLQERLAALNRIFSTTPLAELEPRFAQLAAERAQIASEIGALQKELGQLSKVIVDFRESTSRGERRKFFPGNRHRVAVFTFDDPHRTGLGDAISFLFAKKMLFSAPVTSYALVNYRDGAEPPTPDNLTYFDRVDAIVKDQGFLLVLWGRLSRTATGVRVDAFLQVPADADGTAYLRSLVLPEAMGGGRLAARLKPDRALVLSLDLDNEGIAAVRDAAAKSATLRAKPEASAKATGQLGTGERPYNIAGGTGDWVNLRFTGGGGGWTSVDAFCTGACRAVLQAAVFTNDMVALVGGATRRPLARGVTREAEAMAQQLRALMALPDRPQQALEITQSWTRARAGEGKAPSATFANIAALAQAKVALGSAREAAFNRIQLDQEMIRNLARELADASVADPLDLDVVENLAVLFAYLKDDRRRNLALEIAAGLKKKMP